MRALVVFESMFGNTETVARAIGDGLATGLDVRTVHVGVEGTPGPLTDGERERAVRWGEHLAVLMTERGRTGRPRSADRSVGQNVS